MEKTFKIRVICQLFYPELISTGQTLTELCEELAKMGVDVEVLCGPLTIVDRKSKPPRRMEYEGIVIRRVWGTRFSKLSFLGKLTNQITFAVSVFIRLLFDFRKEPLLVLTNPPFLGIICALLRLFGGHPYIYAVFDVYPDTAVKQGVLSENGLVTRLWNWANRSILRHASRIVVLGRCMEKVILNKGKSVDFLPGKTLLIPIWSDDRHIRPVDRKENPYIQKWKLDGKFVVGYSGNIGRFHDMETIMKSARALREYQDILFLFTGEGYKKKWIQDYSAEHELTNCQFHTYVKREDLGLALACAHVGLVSLNMGQEGLSVPSKTFGILASGTPVIAVMSAESEIGYVVAENHCGYVISPGDVENLTASILDLYANPEKRRKLGNNALMAVKDKYSLRSAASKYLSVIESLQPGMRMDQ